ncbi:MAG: aminotransferase class IV [Bacteroidota bacterium]|nr:aminotransferase class IV [Bacteroidota bacterium]
MNKGKYILVNGIFVLTDEYRISIQESEAFLFAEKIRAVRTNFPFFSETLEIIKLKLLLFNQSFPEFTDRGGAGLRRQLERTLTKNKLFLGAVFTISFRLINEMIQYTIRSEKFEQSDFELNEKGLFIEIFDKIKKPSSSLSNLSLGSEIYWNIAWNHLRNSVADQLLFVNTEDHIIEALEANIYIINGDRIRGASCEHGAYLDITQALLHEIFGKLNLRYSENEEITIHDIRSAEEIMTVNAIEGIRWIVGFEGKRFFNHTIRKISEIFGRSLLS